MSDSYERKTRDGAALAALVFIIVILAIGAYADLGRPQVWGMLFENFLEGLNLIKG